MTPDAPAFLAAYEALFNEAREPAADPRAVRFAALDCETTGLNPKTDRLVSIGAVAVIDGEIRLDDSLEALVKVRYNSAAVTVHGVTREAASAGLDEEEALEALLGYLGDAVIVGHHIRHDLETITAAMERRWGARLLNRSLDVMGLALLLEADGAFAGQAPMRDFSLDALCARFGVKPYGRHTAAGDAFLTAQVFLRLLKSAERVGRWSMEGLLEVYRPPED